MPPVRAPARLAGWLVLVLALGFLGHSLWQSAPWTLAAARSAQLLVAIGAGTLVYGLAGFLLAEAWRHLLGPGAGCARRHYHALYGRTQVAKYLPGNCFHFVGRQLLGTRLGHGHGALALASLAETALLLAVAGALSLPSLWPELAAAARLSAAPVVVALVAALAAIAIVLGRRGARSAPAGLVTPAALRSMAPRLARAGLLYVAFFAVGGLVLWTLAALVRATDAPAIGFLAAVSTMALAWWAGFVVPGAAAGIGVREAALVLSLEPQLGADGAVLVALALRAITTLGDFLFFGVCCFTRVELGSAAPPAHVQS